MTNAKHEYYFVHLAMAKGEKNATKTVVSCIYEDNMQSEEKKIFSLFIKSIHHCDDFLI